MGKEVDLRISILPTSHGEKSSSVFSITGSGGQRRNPRLDEVTVTLRKAIDAL
jgi:type II secretory ATPase GspE/PulE/Tfp pilus assembly ATPase PilB-like protein